ncbi:MAG: P-loop NTPase fold protein, partial [Bacteroidota bacterium]
MGEKAPNHSPNSHRLAHYLLGDAPISSYQDDVLGRSKSAEKFAQQILSLPISPAFAIGIVGAWGSGKTSFLNLIKEKMEAASTDKLLLMPYNPWSRQEGYRISSHFFTLLSKHCGPYSDALGRLIPQYRDQLNNRYRSSRLPFLLRSYYQQNTTYQELFIKINQAFARLNYKIIILIDDIDRLPKEEVIELITLIYKTARLQNICFVTAYDKQYIVKAIESQSEYNADYFLEKVFQLEYHLPKISQSFLKTTLL